MGVATFSQTAFGVLASSLIAEFQIERWQIGALLSAMGFTGAVLSPVFGRVTDRTGSISSTRGVLMLAGLALVVVASAPSYYMLVVGALLFGIANGWTNPATNALIVDNVAPGSRGLVTGIKQSGVQAGAFLGGLLLPLLVSVTNWRIALASFVPFAIGGLVGIRGRPRHRRVRGLPGSERAPIPAAVKWIALYGTLTGLGVSATATFLPLFAEEDQGWSTSQAGILIATIGLVAFVARIVWGSASERWFGHGRTLQLLAGLSTLAATLLTLVSADLLSGWVLVPAALLLGAGASAWNAVGMLAVMDFTAPESVGKSTGFAMLGFLSGVGLGAPLLGLSVDRLGTYTVGWASFAALFAMSAIVAERVHRTGSVAHV
jgi:MFS family permease